MAQTDNVPNIPEATATRSKFWRVPNLDGLELAHTAYSKQKFPRHIHEEYILGVMVGGIEKIDYRGTTYAAPVGSLLLINPGEPHANYAAGTGSYAYRTLYPSIDLLTRACCDIADRKQPAIWFREPVVQQPETAALL